MKREGLSTQAISQSHRVRPQDGPQVPAVHPRWPAGYGPRVASAEQAGPAQGVPGRPAESRVWNAAVLLREIRQRGYQGGYTILKDWLQPQREQPSRPRCADSKHHRQASASGLGPSRHLWKTAANASCGASRSRWATAAGCGPPRLDQKLGTLLRMHEAAFREWGSIPERSSTTG